MKLYLSSQGFGNHLERLKDMVGADRRVLFIDNAKDELPASERAEHVEEKRKEFTAAGFDFYELDLRDYFRSPDKLKPLVDAAPFVWVSGGNTFVLRRAFAYSGFDSLLMNALKNTNMVYGGSSAGSIIMTKTLQGTENGDDPYMVPDGYTEEILWDGLGLIYPQLVPHYQSEWFGKESEAMVDYFKTKGMKYETLKDGEVYLVDGKYEEKLT
ncbi:MAG: Type 1 glutamine amidotransferase-like domain-containing protein [Patescibacteria group bacterium]